MSDETNSDDEGVHKGKKKKKQSEEESVEKDITTSSDHMDDKSFKRKRSDETKSDDEGVHKGKKIKQSDEQSEEKDITTASDHTDDKSLKKKRKRSDETKSDDEGVHKGKKKKQSGEQSEEKDITTASHRTDDKERKRTTEEDKEIKKKIKEDDVSKDEKIVERTHAEIDLTRDEDEGISDNNGDLEVVNVIPSTENLISLVWPKEKDKPKFICAQCGEVFYIEPALKLHYYNHHIRREKPCEVDDDIDRTEREKYFSEHPDYNKVLNDDDGQKDKSDNNDDERAQKASQKGDDESGYEDGNCSLDDEYTEESSGGHEEEAQVNEENEKVRRSQRIKNIQEMKQFLVRDVIMSKMSKKKKEERKRVGQLFLTEADVSYDIPTGYYGPDIGKKERPQRFEVPESEFWSDDEKKRREGRKRRTRTVDSDKEDERNAKEHDKKQETETTGDTITAQDDRLSQEGKGKVKVEDTVTSQEEVTVASLEEEETGHVDSETWDANVSRSLDAISVDDIDISLLNNFSSDGNDSETKGKTDSELEQARVIVYENDPTRKGHKRRNWNYMEIEVKGRKVKSDSEVDVEVVFDPRGEHITKSESGGKVVTKPKGGHHEKSPLEEPVKKHTEDEAKPKGDDQDKNNPIEEPVDEKERTAEDEVKTELGEVTEEPVVDYGEKNGNNPSEGKGVTKDTEEAAKTELCEVTEEPVGYCGENNGKNPSEGKCVTKPKGGVHTEDEAETELGGVPEEPGGHCDEKNGKTSIEEPVGENNGKNPSEGKCVTKPKGGVHTEDEAETELGGVTEEPGGYCGEKNGKNSIEEPVGEKKHTEEEAETELGETEEPGGHCGEKNGERREEKKSIAEPTEEEAGETELGETEESGGHCGEKNVELREEKKSIEEPTEEEAGETELGEVKLSAEEPVEHHDERNGELVEAGDETPNETTDVDVETKASEGTREPVNAKSQYPVQSCKLSRRFQDTSPFQTSDEYSDSDWCDGSDEQ